MNEPDNKSPQAPVTRRSFLKTSSTAVAGGALLGALPVERFALGASPGDTIKVAIVGCGGRGRGAIAQALKTQGDMKLVAMADVSEKALDPGTKEVFNPFERTEHEVSHELTN